MADLRGADLRGAVLTGAILTGAVLRDANLMNSVLWCTSARDSSGLFSPRCTSLSGADLRGANLKLAKLNLADLRGAVLTDAVLHDAVLVRAKLSGANLDRADLSRAYLHDAVLHGANLVRAKLIGANLNRSDLSGADLSGVDMTDAILTDADLNGAYYQPAKPPSPERIARALNLDLLTYDDDSTHITALKQALKDAGFHESHRQVIAAIRRHDASRFDTVMFDWTCEFGVNPARPLWIVAGIWIICTVFYWLLLHRRKSSGLYLLASGKKVNTGNERIFVQRLQYRHPPRNKWYRFLFRVLRREGHALGTAILFSLMSAFNIGFRELNFGRWIRMLQPREFDIKAHGIARVISGTQSLLSIYLVALSVLSYFGTPFDR